MQIAGFASQAAEERSSGPTQPITTTGRVNHFVAQPMYVLRRSNKQFASDKSGKTNCNLLDEMSRPLTSVVDTKQLEDIFSFKKKNFKIAASTGPISSFKHKLSIIVDTGAKLIYLYGHR